MGSQVLSGSEGGRSVSDDLELAGLRILARIIANYQMRKRPELEQRDVETEGFSHQGQDNTGDSDGETG